MLYYSQNKLLCAAMLFGLSSFIRSNGIAYAGFFVWDVLKSKSLKSAFRCIFYLFMILAPFLYFQWYSYLSFCLSGTRPWCNARFPLLYSFVQEHYWNNGFLNYYRLNQIPNFILASPIIYFYGRSLWEYFRVDPKLVFTLGYSFSNSLALIEFEQPILLPYFYLSLFLYLYCILFMHVQVILRFLTAQPFMLWYLATNSQSNHTKIFVSYAVIYSLVAAGLFSVFLPPA
jgi:GPI mannosyltransferase 2